MIEIAEGDFILLKNKQKVTVDSINNTNIQGKTSDNRTIIFTKNDIDCIKKSNLITYGGDNVNYWMFYANNTSKEEIAEYARYEFSRIFYDMTIEEIINKHMYYAENTRQFAGIYKDDTYVLFNLAQYLPYNKRIDAFNSK